MVLLIFSLLLPGRISGPREQQKGDAGKVCVFHLLWYSCWKCPPGRSRCHSRCQPSGTTSPLLRIPPDTNLIVSAQVLIWHWASSSLSQCWTATTDSQSRKKNGNPRMAVGPSFFVFFLARRQGMSSVGLPRDEMTHPKPGMGWIWIMH